VARALLIVNPAAARTADSVLRGIQNVFHRRGWEVDVHATVGPGDARRIAADGVVAGVDAVTVFGGDGTTMQAAAALVGTEVPLGIIPGGTGNQLAGNLRIPFNPLKAAAAAVDGIARPLDLGQVERAGGTHYFAVACGTGIDARIMSETSSALKRKWGTLAYVYTTFRLLPHVHSPLFRITVDGVEHDANAALVLVANCGELVSRMTRLGKGITPYDGQLDVVVLHAESVAGGFRAVWDMLRDAKGTYGKDVFAGHARGAVITVAAAGAEEQPVQLDGELWGGTPFTASVLPAAIRVIHPRG
jgi:YegS/Rv2252/BmrU family lipid kinase